MSPVPTTTTVAVDLDGAVATLTLNRPERMNAFDPTMVAEFADIWAWVRTDPRVRVVVLRAAGDRAFCTGMDVRAQWSWPDDVWSHEDPGRTLSPKWGQRVWKPLICAVRGMAAGGAFYWLNEADLVLAAPEATFFDPHVTYGMTAAPGPIGLSRRIGVGAVLELTLLGNDRRLDAQRAYQLGLVNEVVDGGRLDARAAELARVLAERDPTAVQGAVRAVWESLDLPRTVALERSLSYSQISTAARRPAAEGAS
ncbi:enoyl-CoA hydratase/isomerase family protein [Micromonospora sp. HUAS LYJ1]|uniref:enoyl-CoA hydratase/isomerase family protein n=1 Tax=Micromonospora sp. HUAS LYJ1 TaxID=3061626 RepID=UPI002673882E|nr:enoyl-CoA hydratase/isomerase family protein [Micromonospora sp. HUAS LYJ1]WKU03539.1 enoyl-CoA hydratase/isomerase family protein [Micromonospora sp. HUAS LYJ1]